MLSTVPFLGERTYLQGPSILEALQRELPEGAAVQFKMRRLVRTNQVRAEDAQMSNEPTSGQLSWAHRDTSGELHLFPGEPSPLPLRVPFDEQAIWQRASVDGETAQIDDAGEHKLPTLATSLNKLLLKRLWHIDPPGQWLFVGISLGQDLPARTSIAVRVQKMIRPIKAARSVISIEGREAGWIDFAWRDIRYE